jgi:hypothetical protein
MKLDNSIRFVGVANRIGMLVAATFRQGLQLLLKNEELESYVIKAALRMKTREDYKSKLGKTIYTFALYEKVKRASISLDDSHCMYDPLTGKAFAGPAALQAPPTNVLPLLYLEADERQNLWMLPPTWDVNANDIVGYGRLLHTRALYRSIMLPAS